MPVFASVNGNLSIPSDPHPPDPRYEPVGVGKPLCVEILHWAFGDVEDWWGNSEILSASWSKLGRGAKPGPRLVHFIREGINKFDYADQLGAAGYGHRLVFYTPAYDGRELRLTLQCVELDKAVKKNIDAIGQALVNLGNLPVFAAQLPFVAALPNALELGRKIYNLFNRNDKILAEPLDLRLDDPDFNRLTSGRYVVVEGSHLPRIFMENYTLPREGPLRNRLVTTQDGTLAEVSGMVSPYVVLRVNGEKVSDYEEFEIESAAQEMIEAVLNGDTNLTDEAAELISVAAKSAKEYGTVKQIMARKREMAAAKTEEKKAEKRKEIQNLLKLVSDENQVALLTSALKLGPSENA